MSVDADRPARPPLPRGRHGLSREEVARVQRDRILDALADAMAESGYVATTVGDVIKRAGVSRETFYQQFSSKRDCFDAALAVAGELLTAHLLLAVDQVDGARADGDRTDRAEGPGGSGGSGGAEGTGGGPEARVRVGAVVDAYLRAIEEHPAHARLHLVEVFAAGPEAVAERTARQEELAGLLAERLGRTDEAGRFAAAVLVAGISSLVTGPVLAGEPSRLRALRDPLVDVAVDLLDRPSH